MLTKKECNVIYNNKVILQGTKELSTDLWMVPINATEDMINTEDHVSKSQLNPEQPHIAAFTHSVQTRANAVKFAHQSLCNPKISRMLKATRRGFLTGCPNISENLILKYLNPSPTTAKGHMKRPQHGIWSTTPNMPLLGIAPIPIVPVYLPHVLPLFQQLPPYQGPAYGALQGPNLIGMDDEESIANVFCFGAFADKNNGVVYNDLTGSFLFILLEDSICFLIMYHYKANAILAKPISGLDNISIFNIYKMQFDDLTSKGFKPKINIMDNQATKKHQSIPNRTAVQITTH